MEVEIQIEMVAQFALVVSISYVEIEIQQEIINLGINGGFNPNQQLPTFEEG